MSDLRLQLFRPSAVPEMSRQISVARRLLEDGKIAPWQLFYAKHKQNEWETSLTQVLLSQGWVTETDVLAAQSRHFGAQIVDLATAPPDPRLQHLMDPEFCLKYSVIPWIRIDNIVIYATSRPEFFSQIEILLPTADQGLLMALTTRGQIERYVANTHRKALTENAETRVTEQESCRSFTSIDRKLMHCAGAAAGLFAAVLILSPIAGLFVILALSMFTQFAALALKMIAFFASLRTPTLGPVPLAPQRLPKFSILVPLYKERKIAGALVRRLAALTYPKTLLEVVLVLEESDRVTQHTLSKTRLPKWMRIITVPEGNGLRTKPRAMNYALDFCSGDIIGIWDAEDAPAPDQLETVAAKFAQSADDVACLQGVLDYYNPYTNWLSRCFTIEYAIWFRTILPGLVNLKAPIPLGGTTLFFKRNALEAIGRWDAHNVTEDADLGIRLVRHGYRSEIVDTVTQEEANCRIRPWIRQRSRWIKGYLMTYMVHMKAPRQTYKELGLLGFVLFNALFLTAIFLFCLTPIAWISGTILFANSSDEFKSVARILIFAAVLIFTISTCFDVAAAYKSLRQQQRRLKLVPWVLCLPIYFPFASIAAYKAIFEAFTRPFFWDKTAHGKTDEAEHAEYSSSGG